MKKFNKCADNNGFTMIELMIAVAIVFIMTSIAVPNIIQWLPRYRLKNAVRDMISEFRMVQMQAVKENSSITIVFNVPNNSYYFDTNNNGIYEPGTGERQIVLADYLSGIAFGSGNTANNWDNNTTGDGVTFNGDVLTFGSRSTANTGTVYLQNQNNDICIAVRVLTTGTFYIREYNGTLWVPN